jgi:dihydroorotate dehydrogenase electron transfer subunit
MIQMAKKIGDFKVRSNIKVNYDSFILDLTSSDPLPEILPAQFVQVRISGSPETFLRRPFSIYDVDYEANSLKLLCQVAGKGTEVLSGIAEGEYLNLVYPLGNTFTLPEPGEKVLMVGGGVGIAPFLYFARCLSRIACETDFLFGFRNRERIIGYEEFGNFGKVFITTEDGSEGEKGYVTDHPVLMKKRYDRIYCCGPDPMMKSVGNYAQKNGIFCELSLENLMACGFGICLCCIVPTTRGNICTCTEGPVFNINDLKW